MYKCDECGQEVAESEMILGDTHTVEVGESQELELCGPVKLVSDEVDDDVDEEAYLSEDG